jgi:hypothetical protein
MKSCHYALQQLTFQRAISRASGWGVRASSFKTAKGTVVYLDAYLSDAIKAILAPRCIEDRRCRLPI